MNENNNHCIVMRFKKLSIIHKIMRVNLSKIIEIFKVVILFRVKTLDTTLYNLRLHCLFRCITFILKLDEKLIKLLPT